MPGKKKTQYDWKVYNKQLVERGRKLAKNLRSLKQRIIEFWDEELAIMNEGKEGARFRYPNSQIVFLLILRIALNINSYRLLQGFAHLFFRMVPDYSELYRRIKQLDPEIIEKINQEITKAKTEGRSIIISIDGTGIQINGKYVWTDNKHKNEKMRKRDWKKINIAIDTETRQILAVKLLERNEAEGSHENTVELIENVLENINDDSCIEKCYGDGGYDNEKNFEMFEYLGIKPVIRIRKPSRRKAEQMSRALKAHKRRRFFQKKRNREALKQCDWERYIEESRYGKRSGVEGVIGSFKRIFGERVFSRTDEMIRKEIMTRVLVWNLMM